MPEVTFRFHAELNDFLAPERRDVAFRHRVPSHSSLKDAIEALGVPHPEIGRVLVDGRPAALEDRVVGGSTIEVFPPAPPEGSGLGPAPRFVLDGHLGRLARYLRILGIDASYDPRADDADLAERAATEGRVLLTRDVGLLKCGRVSRGYWLRAERQEAQLAEVVRRFGLLAVARPFGRCLRCDAELEAVDRAAIVDRLPPRTRLEFDEFRRCRGCSEDLLEGVALRPHAAAPRGPRLARIGVSCQPARPLVPLSRPLVRPSWRSPWDQRRPSSACAFHRWLRPRSASTAGIAVPG